MHNQTVDSSVTSSTIPDSPDSDLPEDLLSEELDNRVPACCPEIIRDLVLDLVDECDADPRCAVAVALAVLAATIGPKVAVVRPNAVPVSTAFNAVISHKAPRTLAWFDVITAPFISNVLGLQTAFSIAGAANTRKEIETSEEQFRRAQKTVQASPDLLQREKARIDKLTAQLKPFVLISRVALQDISSAFRRAFDEGLLIAALGSDPADEFIRLKHTERSKISELLNRSWMGAPLSFDKGTYPGTISLLWQTRHEIKDLLGARSFEAGFLRPPILFMEEVRSKRRTGVSPCEEGWNQTLDLLFGMRCERKALLYAVSPGAEAALKEYACYVDTMAVPERGRGHTAWLPDLARRFALLFWILDADEASEIPEQRVVDAITVTKWIAENHLQVLTGDIASADKTVRADRADRGAAIIAKLTARGPLSRRDLWRSFDNPRTDWFNPAIDALLSAGVIRGKGTRFELAKQSGGVGGAKSV